MSKRPPLLLRQLRRGGLSADCAPSLEQWRAMLATIDRTYAEAEQDRYTLERSLSISSREMRELYDAHQEVERRQTQLALRASEERHRILFEASPLPI